MIVIDYKDTRPIYEQIVEKFQILILKGIIEPDSKMPSVRNLAVELSINPNTIQKAYAELERRGFIYTIKGRGNYVAYNQDVIIFMKNELYAKLDEVLEMANDIGMKKTDVIAYVEGGTKVD